MKIDIISLVYKDPHGDRKLTQKLLMESSFIGDAIVIGLHKETFFDLRSYRCLSYICADILILFPYCNFHELQSQSDT